MIFEVTPEHIERLTDTDFRELIGRLAVQEVVRQGHSSAGVTYGGHQNAKDGGIDVAVALSRDCDGYIPRSNVGFQVKAEDMPRAAILKEMRPNPKEQLRPAVVELGKRNGAYIIVSSKGSVSQSSLTDRRNAMAAAIADAPAAASLHLDFYDRRRIATWVNQHPGLIPWVRQKVGLALVGWRPFADWSASPGKEDEPYVLDGGVRLVGVRIKDEGGLGAEDGINRLRKILARPRGAVRLVGLSGVGKTRLIQAPFDARVGKDALDPSLVVYADLSDGPDPVPLELLGHLQALDQRCLLIIDNCGLELHRKLVTKMGAAGGAVSLVTIEYDISDDEPEGTDVFKLEPASADVIGKILEARHPDLTATEIRTIAAFSEGNFRVALVLAEAAKDGESLANLNDSELFKRLFRQRNEDNPALLRAAKICSLVYSFDGETLDGDEAELPLLAGLVEQSVSELYGHVAELNRRQLVQSRSEWRAVLPHALAHRLAKQALADIPQALVLDRLVNRASERLLKSFTRRIGCLHDSSEAKKLVGSWLQDDGWLSKVETFNPFGLTLFSNVAPVDPEGALTCIERAAARLKGEFNADLGNANGIIKILRQLAYEPALFERAVRLIVLLVNKLEDSNVSDDAINVFKSLFHRYLSGTHASPEKRATLLRELAKGDEKTSGLALVGLKAMLKVESFMSGFSFEFGTRRRDYGYWPRTRADVVSWFKTAFDLALELHDDPRFRTEVRARLARNLSALIRLGIVDEVIALIDCIRKEEAWPEAWAGVRSAIREAKRAKRPEPEIAKLERLEKALGPTSLTEKLRSYVLPQEWSTMDLADIDYQDEMRYEKARQHIEAVCTAIGSELANDLAALGELLPALLRSTSTRSRIVAAAIGTETVEPRAVWIMILKHLLSARQDNVLSDFGAVFLAGLAQKDAELATELARSAFSDETLHEFVVSFEGARPADGESMQQLLLYAQTPSVPVGAFRAMGWRLAAKGLDVQDIRAVLLSLCERSGGHDIALDIFTTRLFGAETDKRDLTDEEKALGAELIALTTFDQCRRDEGRELGRIAKLCLSAPRDTATVSALCDRLLDAFTDCEAYPWDYSDLVASLGYQFPTVVLDRFVEKAESVRGSRNFFTHAREFKPDPLRTIADDVFLTWAKEMPEPRFSLLARAVRTWKLEDEAAEAIVEEGQVAKKPVWTPLALALVKEAPDPIAVLDQYASRMRPMSWSGSRAEIMASRLPLLKYWMDHPLPEIAAWGASAVAALREEVERERGYETNRDRERDERFEW